MKRVTQKMLNNFIAKVADIKQSNIEGDNARCYYSKIDGAYFTREGLENDTFKFLLKKGITEELQNGRNKKECTVNLGFNPVENKWYGWSHRAIYGFGVGSKCKKGDCHYHPANRQDFIDDCVLFWNDENHNKTTGKECVVDGKLGVKVEWEYSNKVKNKKIRNTIGGTFRMYPDEFGRGEWDAKTLTDAKQMAIDFASNVS